jgi:hypothetical protein
MGQKCLLLALLYIKIVQLFPKMCFAFLLHNFYLNIEAFLSILVDFYDIKKCMVIWPC